MSSHSKSPTVCLAGVVQGARNGQETADQNYRAEISALLIARYPTLTIFCPVTALHTAFLSRAEDVSREFAVLASQAFIVERHLPDVVMSVRKRFCELVHEAGRADILIAYVPKELSMGTAMEMWSAFSSGRVVVTISPMVQNLAILSTSTVLLPSLQAFHEFILAGELDQYVDGNFPS